MAMLPCLPGPGALALIYGRYSSNVQNPTSADDQNAGNGKFVEQHDWVVARAFKDEALTGRTTRKRKGYYDLMAAVEAGEGQVVVVEDLSRLGRDVTELHIMARSLDEAGVVLCTTSGEILAGMHLAIRAQMAQEYSVDLAYRVRRGHRSAAARGHIMGGVAYGYRLLDKPSENGDRRAKDEAEAAVLLRIFGDYDAGLSAHAICAALNREGVPPPEGQLWRARTVTGNPHFETGLLRNPIYIGKAVFGRTRSKLIKSSGRIKVTAAPKEDRIYRDVPRLRIIPQDLWDRVQARLAASAVPKPNQARRPTYLLSGLCVCGVCGKPFSVVGYAMGCTGRRYGSGCSNRRRVAREAVEDAVLSGLKERLLKPALLDLYLAEYRRELSTAAEEFNERHRALQAQKRDLDQRVGNLIAAIESGAAGEALEVLTGKLKQLERDRRRVASELEAKPGKPPEVLDTDVVIGSIDEFLDDIRGAMAGKERDAVRAQEIFRSFVDKVVITPVDNGPVDRRGCGPVRVTVEGSITELLGQSTNDRVLQGSGTRSATLGLPTVSFRYFVDVPWENVNSKLAAEEDLALARSILQQAVVPIRQVDLAAAMKTTGAERPDRRASRVARHLQSTGEIRPVRFGVGYCGWVLNARGITNLEWRERTKGLQPQTSEPNADGPLVERDLAEFERAADPLDEAVGKDAVVAVEEHRMRRRARVKADRAKRHPVHVELLAAGNAGGGRQE